MVGKPMLWFSFDDLESELPWAIDRFEEKFERAPTTIWLRDKSLETFLGGFGLIAKEDTKLGRKEFYLS
jgi:hypothetical protein